VNFRFDLSGIGVELTGVPTRAAERLAAEWAPFRSETKEAFLSIDVAVARRDAPDGPFRPKQMISSLDSRGASFEMPEGKAEIETGGRARVELARDLAEREYFTLMNLVRACLAWRLPDRGAAMLHAAGLVVDERRGFVLVGSEGAGKSTWVGLGEQAGARAVSDDLVLVDPDGDGYALLGAPFRSTHRVRFVPGRWPLVAILFARQGPEHGIGSVPAWIARVKLTANLTFVADAPASDDRIPAVVDRLAGGVPCAELTFALDPGFLPLLRDWRPGAGG
jgi:hypothetical protein